MMIFAITNDINIFVFTANFEGNSKVILEAMASGCVVIY